MAWTTVEGWSGRVWVSKGGKRVFYIRQHRDGKRWDVSTKCSTLRGAVKELERFESDPAGYRPQGTGEQLVLDEAMIERYASWCRENTESQDPRWLEAKKRYLRWWAEQLGGKTLSSVSLSRILDALAGQPSRKDRVVAIKHLYSWLRRTDQLAASDDPTLDTLAVPQSRPEQDTSGESKVIPEADFQAVLPKLPGVVQELVRLMAGTGCHLSEALRLMESGTVDGNVIGFRHKGGHVHRIEVEPGVAAAARWLIERGSPPARETVYRAIRAACTAAGVEQWTPGRFRHTYATTARQRGVSAADVALALGHTSPATTLSWYATTAVVKGVNGGYR